jgi:signal transduction histidine kinase
MMPNVLLKLGLAAAVRDFVNKIDDERLKISLETFGLNTSLGAETEHIIYRIIQECVNNVIKHAGATALYIQLHKDDESVTVTVEDNGCGFDVAAAGDGVGLRSVRARVAYLNGKVDYDTAPGRGTLVAVYIPLKQHETTT